MPVGQNLDIKIVAVVTTISTIEINVWISCVHDASFADAIRLVVFCGHFWFSSAK
jgi:hypothetical protein